MIEFFMPMIPPTVTHQEQEVRIVKRTVTDKKTGKKKVKNVPLFFYPPELKAARAKLQGHLGKHVPDKPYSGAVRLITKWCFPIVGDYKSGQYKTTKPDTDNLQKLLKDVMTDLGFWTDDALVASEIAEKFWAELPGIYIAIEELET